MVPKKAQHGHKTVPRRRQDGPRWLKWGQDGAKMGPTRAKMGPTWSQDGAKTGPRGRQDGPREAILSHLERPSKKGLPDRFLLDPKFVPKLVKNQTKIGSVFVAIFGSPLGLLLEPFWGQVWAQDRPKRRQDGPKRAIKSWKEAKKTIFKKVVFA